MMQTLLAFENFDISFYIINQFAESNIQYNGQSYSLMKIEHTRTSTGGPLLTQFFETLEKQQCKQKTV